MFWFVLLVFVFNFAFGAVVGVVVELRRRREPRPQDDVPQEVEVCETQPDPVEPRAEDSADNNETEVPAESTEEIPQQWLDVLEAEAIQSKSFVEASVQVLRLEVGRYREALVEIEERIRRCALEPRAEMVQEILQELRLVNSDWLARQAEASGYLSGRRGGLGEFEEVGGELEDVLLDQRAQIETTCSNISVLDFESDLAKACHRLMIEVARLLALAHSLRDRMQDSLITIMRVDNRLESIDPKTHRDALTELFNRTGLEVILHQWWRDDAPRQRLVSMALLDLDHFGRLNEHLGTRACDRLLGAFGRAFDELVPKDRGFNRTLRIAGSSFALFCGDTGPRNALSAVERIRQAFEESTFLVGADEHQVLLSSAVTEIQKDDTPESLLKRLKAGVRAAKRHGRNRTVLDEGEGPQAIEPPEFQVKGRVIHVPDADSDAE